MSQAKCTKCGAELILGTSFCRQCGQPSSEQVTAILDNSSEALTTQRLEARPTTPAYEVDSASLSSSPASASLSKSGASWPRLITAGIVLSLLAIIAVAVIWSLRAGNRDTTGSVQINRSWVYPGSRTIVDMADSGGAVLQLESQDPLETVSQWYEVNLKPTKTLRATSTSVIQKREKVTVTLVSENKITSIVIKQAR